MNICVYGAGAIGSLFAAILSKQNNVVCIARKDHVDKVRKYGLTISGKTQFQGSIPFYESFAEQEESLDLILLTVKSYDTKHAAEDISGNLSDNTIVLSMQNGLDNIEKILKYISEKQVLAGITSHGSLFLQSGIIKHTGIGKTRIGELDGSLSERLRLLQTTFLQSGISVQMGSNIKKDIWKKGIVNASINPLTAIFQCKNAYLLKNPILKDLVYKICEESTIIANTLGHDLNIQEMIDYTCEVILDTEENHSSMFQSIRQKKKTEIHSINGAIFEHGKKESCNVYFNEIITRVIDMMYG
ncbi:MAG: 2-dehydropantoate 2-reductase [Thermoplasmata archaeon]|nr:MAG: 2-dehydropantoate 2-reductase [Thermoplasmata archaeon]